MKCWLAIGRQSHHFVLVAIVRKSQILRQRLIEDAERMWEMHPALDIDHGRRCPTPQAALAKSPNPSTETTAASQMARHEMRTRDAPSDVRSDEGSRETLHQERPRAKAPAHSCASSDSLVAGAQILDPAYSSAGTRFSAKDSHGYSD